MGTNSNRKKKTGEGGYGFISSISGISVLDMMHKPNINIPAKIPIMIPKIKASQVIFFASRVFGSIFLPLKMDRILIAHNSSVSSDSCSQATHQKRN